MGSDMSWGIIEMFLFGLLAVMSGGGAVGVVTLANLVHAALSLVVCLVGVAGLYLLAGADFLAVIQLIVYVGAIAVLLVMGIMLTARPEMNRTSPANHLIRPALLAASGVGGGLVLAIILLRFAEPPVRAIFSEVVLVGRGLLTRYVLHLEVAGLLLLVALVGIIAILRVREIVDRGERS